MSYDFPCTDDSPTNNGYGYDNDIWENRPHLEQDEEIPLEEELDYPRNSSLIGETITVVNKNDGEMEFMNEG